MRKIFYSTVILIGSLLLQSNDTVINSYGSGLFPIVESDIKIQKEILKLSLEDNMFVDVYFEFFNPGAKKKLLVGFVVEPKYNPEYLDNDSVDIEERIPDIEDFKVLVNNENIPYNFGLLKDTPYKEIIESEGKWNYVYYFPVVFKEGVNIVKHSYNYNGGYDSSGSSIYSYVLKTAKNWAGGKIEDFTLIIDMGDKVEFGMFSEIVENPDWKVIGSGKIEGKEIYIKEGYLQLEAKDFIPLNNIMLYVPPAVNFADPESLSFQAVLAESEILESLTKERLRILRNYFFAKEGYKFKSQDLYEYYSSFLWYLPNDSLSSDDIFNSLDSKTQQRIQMIKVLEEK